MKKIYAYALLLALLLTLLPGAALALDPIKLTALEGTDGIDGDGYAKLVDGKKGDPIYNQWLSCLGTNGAYAIVEASEPIILTQYTFYTGYKDEGGEYNLRNPSCWVLSGCNDYTGPNTGSWLTIDKVTGATMGSEKFEASTFDCSSNLAYYKYYKLIITAEKSGKEAIALAEMEFTDYTPCPHSWKADNTCETCGFPAVAQVGDTRHTDLQTAVNNAAGGTVTLLRDLTLKNELKISNTVTLDLAGHSLARTGGNTIFIDGDASPSLTLVDSVGGGTLSNPADCAVYGNRGSFTLRSGTITGSKVGVFVIYGSLFTMEGGVIEGCGTAIELSGNASNGVTMYAHGGRVYGPVKAGKNGRITRRDSTVTTSTVFYGDVSNAHGESMLSGWGDIEWGIYYGTVTDWAFKADMNLSSRYYKNGSISGGTFYGPVIVAKTGKDGFEITGGSFLGGLYDWEKLSEPLPLSSITSTDKKASYTVTFVFPDGTSQSSTVFAMGENPVLTGGPLWKGHPLIWCHRDGTPYAFGTPLTGSLTLYGREENGSIFAPSDGVSLWYEGGNTFGSSRAATPTSVEIDGEPVGFSGSGSRFTVRRLPRTARWITARWNSTSVTVNFTPDADAYIAEVAIPKTGDASIAAYGLLALLAAAGVLRKK